MSQFWYVRLEPGHIIGPVSEKQLTELAVAGRLAPRDKVSSDGTTWYSVSESDWLPRQGFAAIPVSRGLPPAVSHKSEVPELPAEHHSPEATAARQTDPNRKPNRGALVLATVTNAVAAWWTADRTAAACSILLHMTVVYLCAAIMMGARPQEKEIRIDATLSLEEPTQGSLDFGSADVEIDLPAASVESLQDVSTLQTVVPEFSVAFPAFPAMGLAATESSAKADTGSARGSNGASAGQGSGGEKGTGKTSFFGKEVKAGSVGFVIDASGSMAGPRFQRARKELVNSLSKLKSNQLFFVVFYTDQTYPQFYPKSVVSLISADQRTLNRVYSWMELSRTQGGTEPQAAMAMTLGLRPDVIFFLSDGEIPPETREIVRKANRGSVIHTITFGSDVGGEVMRQIATDSDGTHRFIPDGF